MSGPKSYECECGKTHYHHVEEVDENGQPIGEPVFLCGCPVPDDLREAILAKRSDAV
jgi:hypothetical protein